MTRCAPPAVQPRSARRRRLSWPHALLALSIACEPDEDGDGFRVSDGDCDDGAPGVYPGAVDRWNGADDNCDGTVDVDERYLEIAEVEPNDTALGDCFAAEGQDLGPSPGVDLLLTVLGSSSLIVDQHYDDGDRDCYVLSLPTTATERLLEVELRWDGLETDLDFAIWGLWEGEQAGFAQANQPGPGPERAITTADFPGGSPLWIWVAGYQGPPTSYELLLIAR